MPQNIPKEGWLQHESSVYLPETSDRTSGPRAGDRFVVVVYGSNRVSAGDKEALALSIRDFLNGRPS